MSEKSEVQNLTEPTVATEPLDAAPRADDAEQVEDGVPKDYREADGDEVGRPDLPR